MKVAIDGPAGSGKSTVCKKIANKYGLIYLDTGAMYRAATWFSLKFTDEKLAERLKDVDFIFSENGRKLTIAKDGESWDVTKSIRTPAVAHSVSRVSANPQVRAVLTEKQRKFAADYDVIMEGRDITTVVLPDAEIKVFLTASVEERAKRRFQEWRESNTEAPNYEEVIESIKRRDEADCARACAPLKKADDAVLVDTTGLTVDDVVTLIGKMIEDKRASL
ncbi:MAG: (d)CMP kinase [Deferribacterales bacterium]|nr:(d)CMP kinase [Deferribacterales bacterium]